MQVFEPILQTKRLRAKNTATLTYSLFLIHLISKLTKLDILLPRNACFILIFKTSRSIRNIADIMMTADTIISFVCKRQK